MHQIQTIASSYENFQCVECSQAIQAYLISENIPGKLIKLYTGASTGANSFIYDETFPEAAISTNGRHQGVAIIINGIETVFDNHHPAGISRNEWMANLLFQGLVHFGQQFEITEIEF
ncbi:papain fold toxin domain-containing protein [Anabaena azotica]|uniref:papain fold toxin domain-containing protein n=1 Tax=Anabaena azotica TaxID=197653 RepID=UPI0018EF6552